MRRKLIIGIAVIVVAVAGIVGAMVASDLSSLRRDVSDIHYKLGDLENALRGAPNAGTIETVRRRIDIIRDDLRMLTLQHQMATAFFRNETQPAWDRFARVEQQAKGFALRR